MSDIITTLEELKFDKWRETRIEYTESLGDACKSVTVETFMTFDELRELCAELMGGDAE